MIRLFYVLALPFLLAACGERSTTTPNGSTLELPSGVAPVEFPTGRVWITSGGQTHELRVEVAHSAWQKERGLMHRSRMPENSGMLFVYDEDQENSSFWMYNTLIPLSIAYIDAQGVIRNIVEMEPCPSADRGRCPFYPAGVTFRYALEVNRGYFAERGIGPGDTIRYQPD